MTQNRCRITLLAVCGLGIFQLAWILSLIPYYGIDEFDHGLRASAVAEGHFSNEGELPSGHGRGDLVYVRKDVAAAAGPACAMRSYTSKFNCVPLRHLDDGEVEILSAAARYNPTYYAVAATVAKPAHGNANMYVMRAVTAVWCLVFFGLAVWLLLGFTRRAWPLIALFVAVLPTTVYASTVVAPNGVELFAGIALWLALLARVHARESDAPRESFVSCLTIALSAGAMVNTHTLGLLCLGLVLVAFAAWTGIGKAVHALVPRGRREIIVMVLLAVAILFELVWVLLSKVNNPSLEGFDINGSPWPSVANGIILWPLQTIAAFPMRDETAPLLTYAIELTAIITLVVVALRLTRVRSRRGAVILGIAAVSFLVPAVLTLMTYHQIGNAWQGRYLLPFSVGLILLPGLVTDQIDLPQRVTRVGTVAAIACIGLAQLLGMAGLVRRQSGLSELIAATGWHKPSVLLLTALSVVASAAWLRAARLSAQPSRSQP